MSDGDAAAAEVHAAIALSRTYGRTGDALAALEALHRRHPDDHRLAGLLGNLLRQSGHFARAYAIHDGLRERLPQDPAVLAAWAMSAATLALDQGEPLLFDLARRVEYPRQANKSVIVETAPLPLRLVGAEVSTDRVRLVASEALRQAPDTLPVIAVRLLRYMPFWFLACDDAPKGFAVFVDFGDGERSNDGPPRLAFSSNQPDVPLLPDPEFVASGGYRNLLPATGATRWAERRPVALWRGATSGVIDPGETIADLQRVRLVRMARRPEMAERLDAGFHAITNVERLDVDDRVTLEGMMRPFVPGSRYADWRYQVDVDGFSNAWSGMFLRLASGSPVLKVASRFGFRQWYYDRLIPGGNVVPVAADLSDLPDRIDHLRRDDVSARAIGDAGRALALSLSWRKEVEAGIGRAIEASAGRAALAL